METHRNAREHGTVPRSDRALGGAAACLNLGSETAIKIDGEVLLGARHVFANRERPGLVGPEGDGDHQKEREHRAKY
jgi:hypothetical protein